MSVRAPGRRPAGGKKPVSARLATEETERDTLRSAHDRSLFSLSVPRVPWPLECVPPKRWDMYEAQQGQAKDELQREIDHQVHNAEANGVGKEQALKPLGALPDI